MSPPIADQSELARLVGAALTAGDVASLIVPLDGADERAAQKRAEALIALAQPLGVAVVVEGEARLAMRSGADGVHIAAAGADLADIVASAEGRVMVGAGGARTRHEALEIGEARPDYIFFGRFGYDTMPAPHPRNLSLGGWWAQMIEIPCIVQGGSDWREALTVAECGAEFVALSAAVFGEGADPARRIAEINVLLDGHAPRLGATP